jgi:uncharacterized protein YbaP (TraB family)
MNTMLWRSDEAPGVLLLGSIHLLKGELPPWVFEAHAQADTVVFESDFRDAPPPPLLPNGGELRDLDPDLWSRVEASARELEIEDESLARKYPFFVATDLAIASLRKSGATFDQGADSTLMSLTANPLALETVEEFYRLAVEQPPLQEQLESLKLGLADLNAIPERLARAAELWRANDAPGVLQALGFQEKFDLFPEIASGLFANRHAVWLPKSMQLIRRSLARKERILIVVGCAHLTGPQSFLVDLEQHAGLRFRQI